ncbi:MAG: type II secretion system F family protein, partial [Candidatus Wildermuthbacteria bacterium]|nr:type II secretion system F family protein [Candidatus Wildermuthbacteria bacterium]
LGILKSEVKSKKFKRAIGDVLKRILGGESLNRAMAAYPGIFDKFYQNIVKIGEESGSLEEGLGYLASKLRKDIETADKVRGAMIYPAIVILLALAIVFITAFFVLPKITDLFKLLSVPLPLTTRVLIFSVSFFKNYWIFVIASAVGIILLAGILSKTKLVKLWLDKTALSLPVFGRISKNINLAFFARTFYTLLKSGIPLLDSLVILSETMPNGVYAGNIIKLRSGVERGEKISQGLKALSQNFPPIFSEMVLVGERSGTLEESFLYLSDYHEKEVDRDLKNISALVEPCLLILVGIFVAFVALAIITPVYQFTGQLRFR